MATKIRETVPPIKWAGGKRQLLSQFHPLFPSHYQKYLEPFVGGGSVFFYLQPPRSVLIDNNQELINFYHVLQDSVENLLLDLEKHENTPEYFYEIREKDPKKLSAIERASRFLYLNRTSYNGLWRVNRQGKFNAPFGRYKNPKIKNEPLLRRASDCLQKAEIIWGDFTSVLEHAAVGDFIYFDPPYHPLSSTANFTSYTSDSFSAHDQKRLAEIFRLLDKKGCLLMLSNSDTAFIKELYRGYNTTLVSARRAINSKGNKRGAVSEIVIRNYS